MFLREASFSNVKEAKEYLSRAIKEFTENKRDILASGIRKETKGSYTVHIRYI